MNTMNKKSTFLKIIMISSLLVVVLFLNFYKRESGASVVLSVAPSCFEKADCYVPINSGFCDVKFDCVAGKCVSKDVGCPEDCSSVGDEDADGFADCNDHDCWLTPSCLCRDADFNECAVGRCYCAVVGTVPRWHINYETGVKWCACK